MGDPKKQRIRFETPSHPWQGEIIRKEAEIRKRYGLKNKREIWKVEYLLRRCRAQARNLLAHPEAEQSKIETEQLVSRLTKLGLLSGSASLDDVLALDVEAFLARRLQSIVYHKGLASTSKQARQFIIHGHIAINGRKTTIPGIIVTKRDEQFIAYHEYSPVFDELHPTRLESKKEEKEAD